MDEVDPFLLFKVLNCRGDDSLLKDSIEGSRSNFAVLPIYDDNSDFMLLLILILVILEVNWAFKLEVNFF